MIDTWNYSSLLLEGEKRLKEAGLVEAKIDAWSLFSHLLKISRTDYFLREKEIVNDLIANQYFSFINQRLERRPVAYITGIRGFMGMDFYVNEAVLIPEQDTEVLVEEVLTFCDGKDILDLCTGSGCIAISLAQYGNPNFIMATDISKEALKIAEINLSLLDERMKERLELKESDLFQSFNRSFDIIISNPPYIESDLIETLEPEVSIYEPRLALDGFEEGLFFYKEIVKEAPRFLKNKGKIVFEIGANQAERVSALLINGGFYNVRVLKDLTDLDRVVIADYRN